MSSPSRLLRCILAFGLLACASALPAQMSRIGERSEEPTTIPQFSPGMGGDARNPGQLGGALHPTTATLPNQGGTVPALDPIQDGSEVFNRGSYRWNHWFIKGFVEPFELLWKGIFPRPVRTHIRKFGYNLAFPNRLINCMLQNKWRGAGSESVRFLCNTTLGIAGFFDPASKMGLKNYNEDWGQTFHKWGWQQSDFFEIPFMGPSSWRDGLGKIPDAAFNPATYLFGASTLFNFNELSFVLDSYDRVNQSEKDPYALTRDVWAITRLRALVDFELKDNTKSDPSPTLSAVFLDAQDPKFAKRASTGKITAPGTGKTFKYNYWLHKGEAPLVFVIGGAGSFRLSQSTVALAEMCYNRGFSVATISSVLNWEFIQNAASVSVPGFTPIDSHDTYLVMNEIYKQLQRKRSFSSCSLLGVSMGALDTLFIAGSEGDFQPEDLHFARYVAINPPVDLLFALGQIDNFYKAPLAWPPDQRGQRLQSTLLKVSELVENGPDPGKPLPFDKVESNYLIGLTFYMILRDAIYTSQERENLGVLQYPVAHLSRQDVYHEISQYTFAEYLQKFVIPYYFGGPGSQRVDMSKQEFMKRVNLWSIEKNLAGNQKAFVFTNQNDFLLRAQDLEWLRQTFAARLTAFPEGEHIGNLYKKEVQEMVTQPLRELAPAK